MAAKMEAVGKIWPNLPIDLTSNQCNLGSSYVNLQLSMPMSLKNDSSHDSSQDSNMHVACIHDT